VIDQYEQQCVDIILDNHPGDSWVYTNGHFSLLDGMFIRGGVIKAVVEIKARECEFGHHERELMGLLEMEAGKWASKSFCCPFYLFAYHRKSALVAGYKITNELGQLVREFYVRDNEQNKNKDERETKVIRKACFLESSNPSLLKRRGLRCLY
jgi:hypothetical protein